MKKELTPGIKDSPTDRKEHRHEALTSQGKTGYRRLVIKLGTHLLTEGKGSLDTELMSALVAQVAKLHQMGAEIILVSSGAIAAGRSRLERVKEGRGVPFRQVLASVGQSVLMQAYADLFRPFGITVAQALVTRGDLSDRLGYLNVRNTFTALLELRTVPIVNENDVVAVDEIQEDIFGDNDNLSAMVANLVDADLLMILTDTGGLYTADPHQDPSARLIPVVKSIDGHIENLAGTSGSPWGTGGMATKIEAARLATTSGVAVVIADGREKDVILRLAAGEPVGTLFPAVTTKMESRKRWMLSGLNYPGKLIIDHGAAKALREQGRSLLPAGIKEVQGKFQRGHVVEILDTEGARVACGLTNYDSQDIQAIRGARSAEIQELLGYEYGAEVVHRNNLVVL
ncbi:MAG: glutamate 5-kinase [Dehalococcoidia bacterium]